ncbi:MAG: ATPase domain-containing protein [Candidatus Aminicenantes bacterium]
MAENQKIDESQKENILLPYTLEVVEILREIERYVRGRYMERKNSMDLKSLDPQQDIEIIIEIPEIEYKKKDEKEGKKEDGKKDKNEQIKEKSCFFKLLEKIKDHCDLSEFSKELEIGDDILYTMIVILILGRILGYDGKKLWSDIFKMVVTETEENTVIDQPFYQFKFSRDHKIKLVIKDYIAIPRDFVAAYFGYDTGIDGLNQLIYGGFLLPPDRSAYISISGEAGIGKTALVVRLITAFFQNYNFKNVHYSYKQGDTDQINKDDAQPLSIHYILMEQHEKNIIRLIKECQLINENNKNVQPILKKEKEKKVTEKVIRDIIHFEKSDMFSPMGLIEKIESIENPRNDQNKKQRKVIVIDSVNAIQEMDIKRTEWRELFQSIKAITRNGNTIVFFIVEKKSEEPDFVIEYLSDVVIKLYRDYKEEAFYRVFELVESRFQRTISGKHNFYITKPDSGFIRVYPSTTAMGELLPHRKRVKPTDPKEKENRKEVGIKIDGIIHFFRYSHLFQTKMEPFFQKNSISMFIGDRGAHKSAFAKKFALSAFRDERWETPTNYIVEIDYREQEPNKPLEELLTLGFWNATPREKSISLLLYFSENYDEDPENDIIWETYFGKVIIPGCKGEGKNYIGHISHIVCLYEVKDYTEDVYIYQLDELIRAIESCEAKDEIRGKEKDKIPGSYYDFINRKSISRIHRITEAEVASNPINFNPFNILYEGNYIKNSKINRELIDRFIEQEIRIMNFQPDEIDELKKKNQQLLEDINKYKDPAKKEKIKRISKYVENLFNIPIKEYYASLILINKVTPLKRVRGPLIAQLKKICPNNIDQTKKSIDFLVEVSQSLDGVIDEFHDKDKKNILKEMEFFNLLEKLIHRIDFVRRMLFFLALRFTNYPENFKIKKFNKEKYLEKFATASKL